MTTGSLLGVKDLVGTPESVSLAREYVREKLGKDHPALDDVTLLASEVVANAIVHSNSRHGGRVTLAIADCFDRIHVDVVDMGGEMAPPIHGDLLAEGGRGLMLVETISCEWGVYEDDAGRTVWFQVAYEPKTPGQGVTCPGQGASSEPTGRESGLRRTARLAAQTVTASVEHDRGQHEVWRPIHRWGLDGEGLSKAAQSLGVEPIPDGDVAPPDGSGSKVNAPRKT
ncbi:ATP-binding protein [Sphaerisporangium corydalis]|uniref:ATP-binding protein n=1 Tax=Sphaerisporangium corydalis TaxID=1441875 RepID=A0ABV9EGJ8_9ACTN|nr:ATP-binding protein [Sphaerisporangium corydalis]